MTPKITRSAPNLMKKCHMKIRHIRFVISDRGSSSVNNSEKVHQSRVRCQSHRYTNSNKKGEGTSFFSTRKTPKNNSPNKTPLTTKKLTNDTLTQTRIWFASGQPGLSRKHLYHFLHLTLLEITLEQLPQLESIRKASLQHRSGPPFSVYILKSAKPMLKWDKTLDWLL
jgi:hypothetical protein